MLDMIKMHLSFLNIQGKRDTIKLNFVIHQGSLVGPRYSFDTNRYAAQLATNNYLGVCAK